MLPSLVVAPLSTIRNWASEAERWVPGLNVVVYHGSQEARNIIRKNDFFLSKDDVEEVDALAASLTVDASCALAARSSAFAATAARARRDAIHRAQREGANFQGGVPKFHVLLTTYEYASDAAVQSMRWDALVVDEGHSLKGGPAGKRFAAMQRLKTNHRVLLTGTPLQNNLQELFHLLHYLDAEKFDSLEDFTEKTADLSKEDQVGQLHELLAPHMLRRIKKDVLAGMILPKESSSSVWR